MIPSVSLAPSRKATMVAPKAAAAADDEDDEEEDEVDEEDDPPRPPLPPLEAGRRTTSKRWCHAASGKIFPRLSLLPPPRGMAHATVQSLLCVPEWKCV